MRAECETEIILEVAATALALTVRRSRAECETEIFLTKCQTDASVKVTGLAPLPP